MSAQRSVVVVGSGAAGMAAAVAAATSGARVTVLEASDRLGGTTATSGGAIWIPANPWAAAHGVEDSVEQGIRYVRAVQAGGGGIDSVGVAYVHEGLRVTRLVEERTPLRWAHLAGFPDYHAELDGGSRDGRGLEIQPVQVSREVAALLREDPYNLPPLTVAEGELPEPPDAAELARREAEGVMLRGRGLVGALADTVLAHGGELRTGCRATTLSIEGGQVVGVVDAGGERFDGQVVLASGGFERNAALAQAFLRGPMLGPAGPPTNVGDALAMALRAGAAVANMSDAWWVASVQLPGETIDGVPFHRMLFVEASRPGALAVDQTGRRFANESGNYYGFGRALQERDANTYAYLRSPSWIVMDARRRTLQPLAGLGASDADPAWLAKAGSIRELAGLIGVPEDALEATVERFNEQARNGRDEDFGRGGYVYDVFTGLGAPLTPLVEPPFYALRIVPGCSGTKGGPVIDELGRVLGLSGQPVPGLYAAGNAAAYPFGSGFPGGGATLGPALVFGWLAGETAAGGDR
jgi:succinate dehydrogenase/fumarate reductase flavoprotein subunit